MLVEVAMILGEFLATSSCQLLLKRERIGTYMICHIEYISLDVCHHCFLLRFNSAQNAYPSTIFFSGIQLVAAIITLASLAIETIITVATGLQTIS